MDHTCTFIGFSDDDVKGSSKPLLKSSDWGSDEFRHGRSLINSSIKFAFPLFHTEDDYFLIFLYSLPTPIITMRPYLVSTRVGWQLKNNEEVRDEC